MYLQMEPTPPTVYVHLAVLRHFLRVPTKVHVRHGKLAPPAITFLRTAQALRTVFAAAVRLENILRMLTKVHAPRGQLALQAKR